MILEISWRCMAETLCKYLKNSRNPKNSILTLFSIFFLIFNVKFQNFEKKHMPRGVKIDSIKILLLDIFLRILAKSLYKYRQNSIFPINFSDIAFSEFLRFLQSN